MARSSMTSAESKAMAARMAREARLLMNLLEQYVNDRLNRKNGSRRLLYFIDAHEIKAYLNANGGDYLKGFMLEVEQEVAERDVPLHLDVEVRLKAERLLQWLLFDQRNRVILLPSHGDELNQELTYRAEKWATRQLGLIRAASEQLRRVRQRRFKSEMSRAFIETMIANAEAGAPGSKEQLLRFVSETAPALATVLWGAPDTAKERIEALGKFSNLVLLDDVQWETFGLDAPLCERVRVLRANDAVSDQWMNHLRKERQNSFNSNRLDAQAIAYVSAFNGLMDEFGTGIQGVLVTRALTLVGIGRDGNPLEGLNASQLIRHSRFLVTPEVVDLPEVNGAPRDPAQDAVTFDSALLQLNLALSTFVRQLDSDSDDDRPSNSSPLPRPSGEREQFEAARALVQAWRDFEAVRFAFDLVQNEPAAAEAVDPSIGDDEFRLLLHWLKTDVEVESLLLKQFGNGVSSFGSSFFATHWDVPRCAALLRESQRANRLWVEPIDVSNLGPIQVTIKPCEAAKEAAGPQAPHRFQFLDELAGIDVAEDYLIRSLTLACAGQWALAGIYADSALCSAELLHHRFTIDEAKLLQAQLTRLGPFKGHADKRCEQLARVRDGIRQTTQWGSDPRFSLEAAALAIERVLAAVPLRRAALSAPAAFDEGIADLAQALGLDAGDGTSGVPRRLCELALLYLLVGLDHLKLKPDALNHLGDVADWYRQLTAQLESERRQPVAGSAHWAPLARALEIVGFDLACRIATAAGTRAPVPDLSPSIQMDNQVLYALLVGGPDGSDRTSRLVAEALRRVIGRGVGAREFNLTYAAIWPSSEIEPLFEKIADATSRQEAIAGNRILHLVADSQRVLDGDKEELDRLQEASRLFSSSLSRAVGASRPTLFHLEMAECYALLLAAAASRGEERRVAFTDLDARYRQLSTIYSESSVLSYRLSIVLSELGRDADAFDVIKTAMGKLDRDPYVEENHWVRSTVRRRMGYHFATKARSVQADLQADPANTALRDRYRENLREAFSTVYSGFRESGPGVVREELLEYRRRVNNIVYYASLYLETGADLTDLTPSFDRDALLKLIERLQPEALPDMIEWNVVHTVGYAYHVLGYAGLANVAADTLWQLVSRSGASTESPAIRRALEDAMAWKRTAEAEAVSQPVS